MRVCLASQILSHSCSAAIKTYVEFNQLEKSAIQTADFLESVNNMFDLLNSRNCQDTGFKSVLTAENLHLCEIFIHFVKSWEFSVTHCVPIKNALLLTLNSIVGIARHLINSHGFIYVCTSRFNQDPLENFFSTVRSNNGNCQNPTAEQFKHSFNFLSTVKSTNSGKLSNCKMDDDIMLLPFTTSKKPNPPSESEVQIFNNSSDHDGVILNFSETNTVAYIAGNIAKCFKNCNTCSTMLVSSNLHELPHQYTVFFKHKNYDNPNAAMLLTLPSSKLLKFSLEMEVQFRCWVKRFNYSKHPFASYFQWLINYTTFKEDSFCICETHVGIFKNVIRKYFNIRFHFYIKLHNIKEKQNYRSKFLKITGH